MADIIIYFFKEFVNVIITILHLAMFVRAIMSWFVDPMHEGKFAAFLFMITEPVIVPVRALCAKMHWFEGMPLDVPFLLTWLLLTLIQTVIGMI
ncbi:MAG: YggT family protein [Clostridia bacterium]|nr:YggT family protein [Clostridia bacterium]